MTNVANVDNEPGISKSKDSSPTSNGRVAIDARARVAFERLIDMRSLFSDLIYRAVNISRMRIVMTTTMTIMNP